MKNTTLKSSSILTLAALIWGFAFVAQRVGGRYVPAFTFNGLRFTLGLISLIPLLLFFDRKKIARKGAVRLSWRAALPGGLLAGLILYAAAALQQLGMATTTAGKAGFITDLYIVIVPLLGLFLRRRLHALTWLSILIAAVGLYLISVTSRFTVSHGDLLELAGALLWSFHILTIDHFVRRCEALKLSFIQFSVCAALSLATGLLFEHPTLKGVSMAVVPLLYGGICSVGIAYTLQTVGQRHCKPSTSAIILSMESVFSCIGGALMLGENLGLRAYAGCALMITGMVLSNFGVSRESAPAAPAESGEAPQPERN